MGKESDGTHKDSGKGKSNARPLQHVHGLVPPESFDTKICHAGAYSQSVTLRL
jgi:hypothetical protein